MGNYSQRDDESKYLQDRRKRLQYSHLTIRGGQDGVNRFASSLAAEREFESHFGSRSVQRA